MQAAIDHRIALYTSDALLTELSEVLQRPKFKNRGQLNALLIAQVLELATRVAPRRHPEIQLRDTGDHIVIDCALAAKAEYIVTGDQDFILHRKISGVSIVTPAEMLRIVQQ